MNSIARSATVVGLLGFQDHVLMSKGKTEDYSVLTAVFWDVYPVVRSADIPLPPSATQALEHCRRVQDELMDILHVMGLLKTTNSTRGIIDSIYHFICRLTHKRALERAEANYRDTVLLLRDITMDSVTHYHLQHMRCELDHLCGGWDKKRIDLTIPKDATTLIHERISRGDIVGCMHHGDRELESDQGEWVRAEKKSFRFKAIAYPVGTTDGQIAEFDTKTFPLKAIYDTGSDRNLVSKGFLLKYQLYDDVVRTLEEPETIQGAEKSMCKTIYQTAELKWSMKGSNPRTDTFSVIDTGEDSYDILLGWPFILREGVFAVRQKLPVGCGKKGPDRVRVTVRDKKTQVIMKSEVDRGIERSRGRAAKHKEEDYEERHAQLVASHSNNGMSNGSTVINTPSSFGTFTSARTSPRRQPTTSKF